MTALFWIEDRYVQRWKDPRLVSITKILSLLTVRDAITSAERDTWQAELRRIAYSFQAPDLKGIIRDVIPAPITEEQLNETPDLAAWRVWFSNEVTLLQYCEQTPVVDANGSIAGEARHTLDVLAVAREVLWAIWQHPDQPDTEKMIRSSWVWANLRVEQMPFFPLVKVNPAGATTLVALTFAHIADLPLLALMQGDAAVKGPAKSFLPWFFEAIVDPRCAIDPEFESQFTMHMTRTILAVLDWTGDAQGEEREARAHTSATKRLSISIFYRLPGVTASWQKKNLRNVCTPRSWPIFSVPSSMPCSWPGRDDGRDFQCRRDR